MKHKGNLKTKNNVKGITLITLVITIIVLLILAGVSIAMLFGDNGIITQAIWAAFATEMQGLEENIKVNQVPDAEQVLEGGVTQIFSELVSLESLPKSLKMEIVYVRENLPENKEPTSKYYIEDFLDVLVDENGKINGLYYVPANLATNNEDYLYDVLTKTAFKVSATNIKGKTIHSYKYGCKVMGIGTNTNLNNSQYILSDESDVVEVNGEKYYGPNLKGFNEVVTSAIYYDEGFNAYEISLMWDKEDTNQLEIQGKAYIWYDYVEKRWANVKTVANGQEAWWVWIPRYAYKINGTNDIEIIYIDLNNKPLDTEKYGNELPSGYIPHPSFTTDEELKGIWVSKYKPSYIKSPNEIEMSQKGIVPDVSGFDKENTYLIKYSSDGNEIKSETKLSEVSNIEEFNKNNEWYNYTNKIWANVKTVANGQEAWWVWIPRYAYKLPDTSNDDTEIIFIDINNVPLDTEKFGTTLPNGYIVHPAFDQDTNSGGTALTGIWVSKYTPSYIKKPNEIEMSQKGIVPDLSGFDKANTYLIKYSSDGNEITSETKLSEVSNIEEFNKNNEWYNYTNKIWANVKTVANGQEAWWVWIPRYAYKLPDNPNDDTEIIFVDTNNVPLDTEKFGSTLPDGYIVHPAFDQDTNSGGTKLTGIWASKYKPSEN